MTSKSEQKEILFEVATFKADNRFPSPTEFQQRSGEEGKLSRLRFLQIRI